MTGRKLTHAQERMLHRVPDDWAEMPSTVGCTNGTVKALERLGVVELRLQPGQKTLLFAKWDWKRL